MLKTAITQPSVGSPNRTRLAGGSSDHPGLVETHTPATAIMNCSDRLKLGALPMTFDGGRRFVFDLYPWPAHFTAIGSVFALTRVTGTPGNSPKHQVMYVQETDNLSCFHSDFGCMLTGLVDCVGVIPVASRSVRHRVVVELRSRLDPPCNRCWPPDPDRICPMEANAAVELPLFDMANGQVIVR